MLCWSGGFPAQAGEYVIRSIQALPVGGIPDGNPRPWSDTRTVTGIPADGVTQQVTVRLNIAGGCNGDLYGCLNFNGTRVTLLNRPGVGRGSGTARRVRTRGPREWREMSLGCRPGFPTRGEIRGAEEPGDRRKSESRNPKGAFPFAAEVTRRSPPPPAEGSRPAERGRCAAALAGRVPRPGVRVAPASRGSASASRRSPLPAFARGRFNFAPRVRRKWSAPPVAQVSDLP